jgi:exodeoxyribonuclease-5
MMGAHSMPLKDDEARRAAISDHAGSALVEAGAGSGKTAIMAGRVAMMLADGVAPKAIAAVTFTELAAAELLSRVREFVAKLLDGDVPREMETCLPAGLSEGQRTALAAAAESIDEVACATIHGFCQRLIKPYPAEAGIDPGARVTDRSESDLLFGEVKDAWLRERLSQPEESLLSEMVSEDVAQAMSAVNSILDCLRRHPNIEAPPFPPLSALASAYASAVCAYGDFVENGRIREPESVEIAGHFRAHASAMPPAPHDAASVLVRLLRCKPSGELFTGKGTFLAYRKKGKWEAAAKGVGIPKIQAGLLHDQASDHYANCCRTWETLRAAMGACALDRLVRELRPAIDEFQKRKRDAGLLDFDDLIQSALKLLRERDDVRSALAKRYAHVLVDEFQDTDPQQSEIFWRLCGDPIAGGDPSDWRTFAIRPGALFLVGDPKQAIYRFRGADVAAYVKARACYSDAKGVTSISTNFRSRSAILAFVNNRFRGPLSDPDQPGFADLDAFHPDHDGHSGVRALDVDLGAEPKTDVGSRRDAEAEAVADMCERLIGNVAVRDQETGEMRPCRAGDIALLAPTGTNLWRYEAALEDRGIAVATQAGKNLFRQQEIQDLIALTRTLADGRDTLALGAFLRGPLVGLTDEQMLDIAWSLPKDASRPESVPALNLSIDSEAIADAYARNVFRTLGYMRGLSNSTTPHALLSQAVDQFRVRAMLRLRHPRQAERALANLDLFLEMSKAYAVRGLRAFAEAMATSWTAARTEGGKSSEGRVDVQDEAVSLYTMHASKGLEWPIVAPINTMGPPMPIAPEVVDRAANRLYAPVFKIKPDGYDDAHAAEKAEVRRERVRLWYVAATRARDLLVLPRPSVPVDTDAWGALVDLELAELPALDLPPAPARGTAPDAAGNAQDEKVWAAEAAILVEAHRGLTWLTPSLAEADATTTATPEEAPVLSMDAAGEGLDGLRAPVKGGRSRGLVMHKLFEEALNGETPDSPKALEARAEELIRQMGLEPAEDSSTGLSAVEIAGCVTRSLALAEIAALRPTLKPEFPVYAFEKTDEGDIATAGVADAVSHDASGNVDVVVDWKSDVEPSPKVVSHYRGQVSEYLKATGAKRGLIVFATSGQVVKVSAS